MGVVGPSVFSVNVKASLKLEPIKLSPSDLGVALGVAGLPSGTAAAEDCFKGDVGLGVAGLLSGAATKECFRGEPDAFPNKPWAWGFADEGADIFGVPSVIKSSSFSC